MQICNRNTAIDKSQNNSNTEVSLLIRVRSTQVHKCSTTPLKDKIVITMGIPEQVEEPSKWEVKPDKTEQIWKWNLDQMIILNTIRLLIQILTTMIKVRKMYLWERSLDLEPNHQNCIQTTFLCQVIYQMTCGVKYLSFRHTKGKYKRSRKEIISWRSDPW